MDTEQKNFFEESKQLATKYIDDRLLLLKLQAAEKAAKFSSALFKVLVAAVLLFFIALIISFLAGYYLSVWLGCFLYGFGALIILYILLLFITLALHKKYLHKYISDKVVEMFFNNND